MMRKTMFVAAALSLLVCLVTPLFFFWGSLGFNSYRHILVGATMGWFFFATWLAVSKKT